MGIRSKLNAYPSEVLGGLEDGVSPLEMANAYATIASGGWRNRPKAITRVTFPDGRVSNWGKPARHKAFRDGVTYEATKILEQNMTGRHRHRRADRLPRGRQDGHDRQQHRRLVRRLHAEPVDGGLGRLPRPARADEPADDADQRRGRHVPGVDLGEVHEGRQEGLRRLPASRSRRSRASRSRASTSRCSPSARKGPRATSRTRRRTPTRSHDGNGNGGGADNGGAAPQGGAQPAQPQAPAAQPQPASRRPPADAARRPARPQGGAPVDPAQYVAPG